jgi:hypothetical protein
VTGRADDPASQRLARQPLDEASGVRQRITREAPAARSAQGGEPPAHGGHRVHVQRVDTRHIYGRLEQEPLHAIGVAQRIPLRHVGPVRRGHDGEPVDPELHSQRLDVLDRVARTEETAPVPEQGRAGRSLAARVGGRGSLEITAAKRARSGPSLVEEDQVPARRLPQVLVELGPRLARGAGQQQRHAAVLPVVAVMPLDAQ